MFKQICSATAICLAAGSVLAGTPALNARQHHERARIAQGIHSGELTRPEAARLINGQQHLRRLENRAKSDDVVTAGERARLRHAASVQSRRIYIQRHDNQERP